MNDTNRRHSAASRGPAGLAARGLSMLVLALACLIAFAAAPSAQRNPRLASLQIEIWPEYDRPAALVILRGELAPDVALPAEVSLRIAAETGGPSAVAYASAASGNLMNLKYERSEAKDFVSIRFKVPERFFHVEFYDPLATNTPERRYTYVWPGDLTVGRLSVILQEPAAAGNISVEPNLDASAAGQEGLRYRSADLGPVDAGKPLPIKIRYTKTDSRTSSELLKPAAKPVAAGSTPVLDSSTGDRGIPGWLAVLAGAAALAAGAGAAAVWMWRRRRAGAAAVQSGGAGICSECGNPMAANDRFCSKCGAQA